MNREEWNEKLKQIFKEKANIDCDKVHLTMDSFDDSYNEGMTPMEAFTEEISYWND